MAFFYLERSVAWHKAVKDGLRWRLGDGSQIKFNLLLCLLIVIIWERWFLILLRMVSGIYSKALPSRMLESLTLRAVSPGVG